MVLYVITKPKMMVCASSASVADVDKKKQFFQVHINPESLGVMGQGLQSYLFLDIGGHLGMQPSNYKLHIKKAYINIRKANGRRKTEKVVFMSV